MIYTNENWKPPVTYCEPNKVEVQRMNKEEAIEILRDIYQFLRTQYTHRYKQKEAIDLAIEALQAKTNDKGEWIRWVVDIEDDTGVSYIPHAKCSNCGTEQDSYISQFINFCPNCGAYMAKENEE